jgi:hypothetical protein
LHINYILTSLHLGPRTWSNPMPWAIFYWVTSLSSEGGEPLMSTYYSSSMTKNKGWTLCLGPTDTMPHPGTDRNANSGAHFQ